MNNEDALIALENFIDTASNAVQIGVWAQAFLQEGGEPTWDAVKSVSDIAERMKEDAALVAQFRNIYEDILP